MMADIEAVYRSLAAGVGCGQRGIRPDASPVTWTEKIVQSGEKDDHNNVQLSGTGALADFLAAQVKAKLGVKRVRADTLRATFRGASRAFSRRWTWSRPGGAGRRL